MFSLTHLTLLHWYTGNYRVSQQFNGTFIMRPICLTPVVWNQFCKSDKNAKKSREGTEKIQNLHEICLKKRERKY